MLSVLSGRRALVLACAVLVTVAMVSPAVAQSTGILKGKVVDATEQPVEAAKVTIDYRDGIARTNITKTNKKGEYTMVGLSPGNYRVTAEKEKVGAQMFEGRVRLGETTEINFKLAPGSGAPAKEDVARAAAIRKVFDEGVAASRSGDNDTALAKFAEAIVIVPACFDCYYNMGYAYSQKKEFDKAEEAYKKALEIKPEYVEAYNGLAQIYNMQKKFDEAQAASQKAATLSMAAGTAGGAGGADSFYNVGVAAWNGGRAEDAKKAFEEALKLDPKHANAHYQLAMCFINLGKLPEAVGEFEQYLQTAPDGQYAAQVKAMLTQLKK